MIKLYDRIKEISYTIGTGNLLLSGAVNGFSSFSSSYSNNDALFYAVTDGTNYEIGSGVYLSSNQIKRFPFKTTNSNQLVNFAEGLKEVYVTYPATHSVLNTSGTQPIAQSSGLAIWNSSNSLSYNDKIVFDSTNGRLGINKAIPSGTLDIGGLSPNSNIVVSGIHIGNSGIYFPSGNNGVSSYSGGRQLVHFEPNQLDINSSLVLQLSGIVNQNILLKKQSANTIFAGPSGECVPPCSPDYPMFRYLVKEDIPDLSSTYLSITDSNILSGILNTKISTVSGISYGISGILNNKINTVSGILNNSISILSDSISGINTPIIYTDGRLSLSSGNSVVDGSGHKVFYTKYAIGNKVSLYNTSTSTWQDHTIPSTYSNISIDFSDYNPYKIYDIFLYYDSSLKLTAIPWNGYIYDPQFDTGEESTPFITTVNYVTSGNISSQIISSGDLFPYGSISLNGHVLSGGEVILVKNQIEGQENGIYEVIVEEIGVTLSISRIYPWIDGSTLNGGELIYCPNTNKVYQHDEGYVIGTDGLTFIEYPAIGFGSNARSSQLTQLNNAYVLSSDFSKRYVGSVQLRTLSYVFDLPSKRLLFNCHNRVAKNIFLSKSTTRWVYQGATWRNISYLNGAEILQGLNNINNDNSKVSLNGQVHYDLIDLAYSKYMLGFGKNNSTLPISGCIDIMETDYNDNVRRQMSISYSEKPAYGWNKYNLMEKGKYPNYAYITINDNLSYDKFGGIYGTWEC